MPAPNVIIIGGGAAAIAMAHALKHKLGFNNFEIYEKREGLGGTWRINTYPGCGSDVPIHLYSFSFNLNPDWTQALADQEEILRYIENTVDKFNLRSHFHFKVECTGAEWVDGSWHVHFLDTYTGEKFTKQCTILLSAVGGFSIPRQSKFPGMDKYKGRAFHTAEWDHTFDWRDKKVAVIGNGCSAAQVVPSIAPGVKKLVQYARSPQWYHPRPNRVFSSFEKFCFRYVPLYQRYHRLDLFLQTDDLASVYGPEEKQIKKRLATEAEARSYILSEVPKKYHHFIVPDFPLGCKRRIYDPGYLAALRRDNVELLPEGIQEFTETGLISEKGKPEDFDAVILATGFDVSSFLAPMKIIGKTGEELRDQWSNRRGAQAYMGTFVHNNPNFAILFGPNTFPAFNSVIYAIEVQVDYITSVLVKPIVDGYTHVVEVKQDAEEDFVENLDRVLSETVFSAGCSNWYINKAGRNSAAWPGEAVTFWKATYFPTWSHFLWTGGSSFWMLRKAWRNLKTTSPLSWLALIAGTGFAMSQGLLAIPRPLENLFRPLNA
ncbi:monooxygenase [Fusarium sp. NRRL 25303]|nr:monooxygenase [Fusarium sp. NRRL 25303]